VARSRVRCYSFQKVQNTALVGITGAFRTSPSAALHNEAAMPYMSTRITNLQTKYAAWVLGLPHHHPMQTMAPSTLPNQTGLPVPRGGTWTEWDQTPMPAETHFLTRIDRIMHLLVRWINRDSMVPIRTSHQLPGCNPPYSPTSHPTTKPQSLPTIKNTCKLL
jgi:hypothetical protein